MKTKKKAKRSWKNDKSSSESSTSDSDTNVDKPIEHDLTDYAGNSIKLMTEIFKILGDKKLKTMIPNILKPIDMNDLKACLAEESMALSKKRLISILNGETYSSSSSDSEEGATESPKKISNDDIISLDGISDDSDIFYFDELPEAEVLTEIKKENAGKKKKHKKPHKQEKVVEKKKSVDKPLTVDEEKAMTALELLELQARARAIKSQLALESVTSPIDNVEEEIKGESSEIKMKTEQEIEQPKTRKVKLRRDHLRIDPNRTNNKSTASFSQPKLDVPEVGSKPPEKIEVPEKVVEMKRERRSSTDSLIVESPSHPLIVISSDDEGKGLEKTKEKLDVIQSTQFTEIEKNLVSEPNVEVSSSEEGEVSSEDERRKQTKKVSKNESKNDDQDFIIIDCEPDLESDPDETTSTASKEQKSEKELTNDTWKDRWLDSRKVKTVLQTSKLCNNMKRKICLKRDQQSSPKTPPVEQTVSVDSPSQEVGSVEQFNSLTNDKKVEESETVEMTEAEKPELESSTDYFELVSDSDEK